MKNKLKKCIKENWLLIFFIIIQSIIYCVVGANKQYLHIDEAYSFGLANYDKVEFQNNDDFFNVWHDKEYYEDYLSVQKEEIGNYKPVYENQKNDVHPPLYYLILRIAMEINCGHFSKWIGIAVNVLIYALVTIFMYVILNKLLKEEKNAKKKATVLAFISSITLASISNVVYIRMYALLTLEILITLLLHIKLSEKKKENLPLLVAVGITVIAGALTHYYYFLIIFILYLIFMAKYIKEKRIKEGIYYTITIFMSLGISVIIFPYMLQHMFFGYRGKGVIDNFKNTNELVSYFKEHLKNLNYYGFNGTLFFIILFIIVMLIYKKGKLQLDKEQKDIIKIILIPSIFFFIISAIGSPWRVLRYIVPVCSLIFVIVIYFLYKLLVSITNEKITNIIMITLFCIMAITPSVFNLEPELLYQDRKEFVKEITEKSDLPTAYFYNPQVGSFLDDIYIFSMIDKSYISKDMEYTESDVQKIFKNQDISKGIIIFINHNEDEIIQIVKKALNLSQCEHLKKLTACNVYYLANN